MKKILDRIKPLYKPFEEKVLPVLEANQISIRAVGGCVRDALLNVPINDVDFCTSALPETLLALQIPDVTILPTGLDHGTVTFVIKDNGKNHFFEVTTLRIDTETDGRHAVPEFTTDYSQDAKRRDFTINAMSIDLATGQLFDYFNGQADLRDHFIRFVGNADKRIEEDYLRMLRAMRFVSKLGFQVIRDEEEFHPKHLKAFSETISGERIWAELVKICKGRYMNEAMLLSYYMNLLPAMGLEWLSNQIDNSPGEPTILLNRMQQYVVKVEAAAIDGTIMDTHNLASILIGATVETMEQLEAARTRLKVANKDFDVMKFVFQNRDKTGLGASKFYTDALIDGVSPDVVRAMVTYYVITRPSPYAIGILLSVDDFIDRPIVCPVNGDDLLALKFKEGREFGIIMRAIKELWKESHYELTKEEILNRLHL